MVDGVSCLSPLYGVCMALLFLLSQLASRILLHCAPIFSAYEEGGTRGVLLLRLFSTFLFYWGIHAFFIILIVLGVFFVFFMNEV